MKHFIFVIILLCLLSVQFNSQWIQTSGPNGQTVFTLVNQGSLIYAGTVKGIFKTSNNGDNWTQIFSDTTAVVQSIVLSNSNIYAGTSYGLYESSNGGQSWSLISLNSEYILSLATSGTHLYAGTWLHGIYSSSNMGTSWSHYSIANQDVFALATNGTYTFAGATGVYISSNYGLSWGLSTLNNQNVYCFAVNGTSLYAGTFQNGIFVTTNNGQTWIQNSLNNQYVWSLAFNGTISLAATNVNGVYMSLDNGANWTQKNEGLGNQTVRSILFTANSVFIGTNNSVWKRSIPELVSLIYVKNDIPKTFYLNQNFPNPFNPSTRIKYQIPKNSFVLIEIFDYLGRKISTLLNSIQPPGQYEIVFDGENFSSGVYYYKLTTDNFTESKKMILLK